MAKAELFSCLFEGIHGQEKVRSIPYCATRVWQLVEELDSSKLTTSQQSIRGHPSLGRPQ